MGRRARDKSGQFFTRVHYFSQFPSSWSRLNIASFPKTFDIGFFIHFALLYISLKFIDSEKTNNFVKKMENNHIQLEEARLENGRKKATVRFFVAPNYEGVLESDECSVNFLGVNIIIRFERIGSQIKADGESVELYKFRASTINTMKNCRISNAELSVHDANYSLHLKKKPDLQHVQDILEYHGFVGQLYGITLTAHLSSDEIQKHFPQQKMFFEITFEVETDEADTEKEPER